jgi:CheY-like chemotaxis protein
MKHEGKTNILIVENDERILGTFQKLLEDEGFSTVSTWSGREALSLLQSGLFHVLLVDDYMPDLHAYNFLHRVGRLAVQSRVVVMQGSMPTSIELQRYERLGAATVVDKRDSGMVRQALYQYCAEKPLTSIN